MISDRREHSARYLTPDPLGLVPAPNPTTYVRNPHGQSDSLGLAPECPRGKNGCGTYDFREPSPDYPPDAGAAAAIRSAPICGNIDCSDIAECILREGGGRGSVNKFHDA